jgi:sugar lactone lactonase YvrE
MLLSINTHHLKIIFMKRLKLIMLLAACILCRDARAQTIFTVAGLNVPGYSGDGGHATSARLQACTFIELDPSGNLYILDYTTSRIRKVATNGIITLYAGTTAGFSGDGGAASAAKLNVPTGLACDGAGNVFIADHGNFRIRKINTLGIISTVAGNGTISGGDGGPASAAGMFPGPMAVDGSGRIYFVDVNTKTIRKIDATGIISTIGGNGTTGYTGDGGLATAAGMTANGLAVDATGNVFFADFNHHCIRKISAAGIITTVAGTGTLGFSGDGGPATAANFYYPTDLSFDTKGNLYVSDVNNLRVRKIDTGGIVTTEVGNGTLCAGGCGDGGPATAAGFDTPYGIAIDAAGSLYISDRSAGNVREVKKIGAGIAPAGAPRGVTELHIFPDPNSGSFAVSVSSAEDEPVQVVVTDITGRWIKETAGSTNKEIELQLNVKGGMYFVNAATSEGRWSGKVVVR